MIPFKILRILRSSTAADESHLFLRYLLFREVLKSIDWMEHVDDLKYDCWWQSSVIFHILYNNSSTAGASTYCKSVRGYGFSISF